MKFFFNLFVMCAILVLFERGHADDELPPEYFHAAACCARGPECYEKHARLSLECKQNIWMDQQSKACQKLACDFCSQHEKRLMCQTYPILWNCFEQGPPHSPPPLEWKVKTPSPSPEVSPSSTSSPSSSPPSTPTATPSSTSSAKPSSSPSPSTSSISASPPASSPSSSVAHPAERDCIFYSNHGFINIAARSFPLNGLWTRTIGGESVIWRRNGGAATYKPSAKQAFCVRYKSDYDGLHYFTAVTSAPHGTEHNDAWFRFSIKTILYRPKDKSLKNKGVNTWMKGYQNQGNSSRADYILTIDKEGHQIFLNDVRKDKVYKICVSGRSTQFQIYNLAIFRCRSLDDCNRAREPIREKMRHLPNYARCAPEF